MKMHTCLNFPGNAAEAFEFYRSVFGGELSSHVRSRDMPMEGVDIPEGDQDKRCTSRCRSATATC